jgi:hypothetical protein
MGKYRNLCVCASIASFLLYSFGAKGATHVLFSLLLPPVLYNISNVHSILQVEHRHPGDVSPSKAFVQDTIISLCAIISAVQMPSQLVRTVDESHALLSVSMLESKSGLLVDPISEAALNRK